jgi:hypothetical protein
MGKAPAEGRLSVFQVEAFDIRFWKFSLACWIVETRLIAAVRVNVKNYFTSPSTRLARH